MKRATLIIGAGLVIVGGGLMANRLISKAKMAALLRDAFDRWGLPAAWGEALGRTESNLDPTAVNNTGADAARGGAWGPTQITEKTLRAHGFTFPVEKLIQDPALAADVSAQIAAAGNPMTIEDLGAWWNAGRASFAALPADHVTRTTYVPRLVANLGKATA